MKSLQNNKKLTGSSTEWQSSDGAARPRWHIIDPVVVLLDITEEVSMDKKEVIAALEEIATLLELSGENPFKTRSYVNAARELEMLEDDLETLVREKRLRQIKGVGDALEKKIEELVTTGHLKFLDDLRGKFPNTLYELFAISGLGPKRIKIVYEELGVDSLEKLGEACRSGRVAELTGFSTKLQEKIVEGLAFSQQHQGQFRFDVAYTHAEAIRTHLEQVPGLIRLEVAGSLRRRKEVVKDIDIVTSSSEPKGLMKQFVEAPGVTRVTGHGDTKSSVVLESGIAVDLRVVADEQFPYALAHFTGSKDHNVVLRQRAKDRGLKLNEYGLFRDDDSLVTCADEAAILRALGLPFIPPELRENMGEFNAASLPRLVERDALKGVYHCHSNYSDGLVTIAKMAEAARDRGYAYILISDHSQSANYANGLKPDRVRQQHAEIDRLNQPGKKFRILKGIESDIRTDGHLDYEDEVLATFDLVIASIHSKLEMSKQEATERTLKAVENPYTDILGHLTGRLLLTRPGFSLDMERVLDACAANRVAVEINANPQRLDIDWRHIKRGKDKGVKFVIGPDAHRVEGLDDVDYGLGIARKGWLEPGDLLNTMSAREVLAWRKSR